MIKKEILNRIYGSLEVIKKNASNGDNWQYIYSDKLKQFVWINLSEYIRKLR